MVLLAHRIIRRLEIYRGRVPQIDNFVLISFCFTVSPRHRHPISGISGSFQTDHLIIIQAKTLSEVPVSVVVNFCSAVTAGPLITEPVVE